MAAEVDDASAKRSYPMGVASLSIALGLPVLGFLLALPSGTWVIMFAAVFLGGGIAATIGQFAITDAKANGDRTPIAARVGRCLGWLEVLSPILLFVLFMVALNQWNPE